MVIGTTVIEFFCSILLSVLLCLTSTEAWFVDLWWLLFFFFFTLNNKRIVEDYMILYDIIWHYMILYDIIWYYMILYDIIWYYMIIYDIIWYYMILYDIIWYYMIFYVDSKILKVILVKYQESPKISDIKISPCRGRPQRSTYDVMIQGMANAGKLSSANLYGEACAGLVQHVSG